MADTERIGGNGMSAVVPRGWDASFFLTPADPATGLGSCAVGQFATIPLPNETSVYGSGLVEFLGYGDAFVVILDFGEEPDSPLFTTRQSLPVALESSDFHPQILRRTLEGQAGCQLFFRSGSHSYCLYAVVGYVGNMNVVLPEINELLGSVALDGMSPSELPA